MGVQKQPASLSPCPCPGDHLLPLGISYPTNYPSTSSKVAPQAQGQPQDTKQNFPKTTPGRTPGIDWAISQPRK